MTANLNSWTGCKQFIFVNTSTTQKPRIYYYQKDMFLALINAREDDRQQFGTAIHKIV